MNKDTINTGKTLSVVTYLTLFGTLIAFFLNQDKKNDFTSFHIRQSLGLGITYIFTAFIVTSFDSMPISIAFWICFAALYLFGIIGAISGKMNCIPWLGNIYQNTFKSIGQ